MEDTKKRSAEFKKAFEQYVKAFNKRPPIDADVCDAMLVPERKLISLMNKAITAKEPLHWSQTYMSAWNVREPPTKRAIIKRFKMTFGSFCPSDLTEEYMSYDIDEDGFVKIDHGIKCCGVMKVFERNWKNIFNIDCIYDCVSRVLRVMSRSIGIMETCNDHGCGIDVINTNQYKITNIDGRLMTENGQTIAEVIGQLREYIDDFNGLEY